MTNIIDLINQIHKLGLDKNPRIMGLLRSLIIEPHNKERWTQINHILKPILAREALIGKPFSKPDESVAGTINFALTDQNLPVGFNFDEPHMLIAGQTGCGKSVLLMIILSQAIVQGV